jgi:hypothetical protein
MTIPEALALLCLTAVAGCVIVGFMLAGCEYSVSHRGNNAPDSEIVVE